MGSLTAHLLEPGDHGRLRFHPSCPVCRRERLFGTLSSEPVVSRRTQAVLASGVLAISAGPPGLAIAAVPDRQAEGIAAPEDAPGGELDDPGFDPGGETSLPFETAPVPPDTGTGDAGGGDGNGDDGAGPPIDAEPVEDLDARIAPLVAEEGVATGDSASPVTGDEVPPATGGGAGSGVTGPASPPSAPALPPAVGQITAPGSPPAGPSPSSARRGSADRYEHERNVRGGRLVAEQSEGEAPVAQAPASPPLAGEGTLAADGTRAADGTLAAAAAQPVATTQTAALTDRDRGAFRRDARVYVVQPGDSLWSIAKRLLGADASPARIARMVDRLWTRNRDTIATGDPDLLRVGTELRLR